MESVVRLSKEDLVDICRDLDDSDDLKKLKFLLKDVAGFGKLKSATSALELFMAIENNKNLELLNGRFLAECFEIMGRTDLVRQIGFDTTLVQNELGSTRYSLNDFRILLYRISEDLSTDEFQKLLFHSERVFQITRKEKQLVDSSFDLFVLLEKRGAIGPQSVNNLKKMVQTLENRGDLYDMVRNYQGDNCSNGDTVPLDSFPQEQPQSRPSIDPASLPMPYYEMTANPRGFCVIINNKNFRRMRPRQGTDEDQVRLEASFRKLGFRILVYKDLKSTDIVGLMKDIQVMDHSECDALVICILSHGGEHFVYRNNRRCNANRPRPLANDEDTQIQGNFVFGTDDKPVPIRYLTMYFRASHCKTLANKPKLFFIQACQGEDNQTGVLLETDVDRDGPSMDESLELDIRTVPHDSPDSDSTPVTRPNDRHVIPDESDFMLGYATVFGYVSYRSRSQGSFYIKSLTENLDRFADTLDLQQIMTKVNHDVSERNVRMGDDGEDRKQVPMTQNQLRKLLYFSPDNIK